MVGAIRRQKVEVLANRQSPDMDDSPSNQRNPYDIILLQDTSLKASQCSADILGSNYTVYHDPSPSAVGRGVAIAIRTSLGASLTNIKYGSNIDKMAAGRVITGDLTFPTKKGDIKIVELTSFYVPCDEKAKQPFLNILGTHLREHSKREGVARIAGGDGNGVWEPNERIRNDGTPNNNNSEEASAFRTCMESCTDLFNQKPPVSFDPETLPTHIYDSGKSRIDYLFMNAQLEDCVRHTSPLEQICVPTESKDKKTISAHHWIEAVVCPLLEVNARARWRHRAND
jgi:exonuclease III